MISYMSIIIYVYQKLSNFAREGPYGVRNCYNIVWDVPIKIASSFSFFVIKARPSKLKKSLTPGTVAILLAGRHKGKRVVFLKDLQNSGLILVTGPYKVNGVPLRRVPQSYVIGTQTKIDISACNLPDIDASIFKRQAKAKAAGEMFEEAAEGYTPSEERKSLQESVDEAILGEISKTPHLRKYMQQLFTLRKKQFPHEMQF